MTKWHIADEANHNRPACAPTRGDYLTVPVGEWIKRISSDQCQRCAKAARYRVGAARRAARVEGQNEPIHPESMRELRNLVKLHGAARIRAALDEIVHQLEPLAARPDYECDGGQPQYRGKPCGRCGAREGEACKFPEGMVL